MLGAGSVSMGAAILVLYKKFTNQYRCHEGRRSGAFIIIGEGKGGGGIRERAIVRKGVVITEIYSIEVGRASERGDIVRKGAGSLERDIQ